MADVRPSIPRTPAQVTLRVVSAIMALLGGLVVVGAALVFLNRDQLGLAEESMWTVLTYGGIILAAAGLLLLTAWLGFRAADDSSRVGPYRFLCYFVGLVVLVAIVWGWGMGMFLLFNPVVLASTVTYVLVCSQLADKVAEEHEAAPRDLLEGEELRGGARIPAGTCAAPRGGARRRPHARDVHAGQR